MSLYPTHRPVVAEERVYSLQGELLSDAREPHPIERAGAKLRDVCTVFSAVVIVACLLWIVTHPNTDPAPIASPAGHSTTSAVGASAGGSHSGASK